MNLIELRLLLADLIKDSEFAVKTFFAGGCVRDYLLGRTAPKLDADIAVELPQGGIRLARFLQTRLPSSPPQIQEGFGTASFQFGDIQLDFVMTRSETYQPGSRHPRVKFANLHADCLRRDFTINALYQELQSGEILDPSGRGLSDLRSRTIRSIQDPHHSFAEDPLRMLRALRFAAVLGFEIEPSTLKAIKENSHLINTLSRQRCQNEQERLYFSADNTGKQAWHKLLDETGSRRYLDKKL